MLHLTAATLDLDAATVWRDGEAQPLTALELELLRFLLARPGEVVTRDTLLVEVWGYKPGLRTRAVDNTVARLRAKLEADPKEPRHLHTVRGVGYRFDLPAEAEGETLVGRSADLDALEQALSRPCVTLLGPAGVGKTTLARALLERHEGLFIDLTEIQSAAGAAAAVLAALGQPPGADPLAALPGALREAPRLLVLDNAEGAAEALRGALSDWLRGLPSGATLLLTSRVALNAPEERRLHLAPLDPAAAERLMQLRLPPEVQLDAAALAPLLARLDGLPLAIELAAAWLDLASPGQLSARLDQHLQVLRDRHHRHPERHASLAAALQLSWDQLDPVERSALAQCALFVEGFDLAAAEAVLSLPEGRWPLELLGRLRDKSLLVLDDGPRYRLLDTVRVFARAQLEDPQAALRHAQHYAARAEAEGSALFRAEAANARAALERCVTLDPALAMALYVKRFPWVYVNGVIAHELALNDRLTQALGEAPSRDRARALWARAQLLTRLGDAHECLRLIQRALEDLPQGEAPGMRAQLMRNRGYYALLCGRVDDARAWLSEALIAARAAGHLDAECFTLFHLAELEHNSGGFDQALAHVEAIEARARGSQSTTLVGDARRMRALACVGLGRWREAEQAMEDALAAAPEGSFTEALSRILLATMYFAQGRVQACVQSLERAERLLVQRADAVASASTAQLRALLSWRAGDLEEAERALAEVQGVMARHGRRRFEARATRMRAAAQAERGLETAPQEPAPSEDPVEVTLWASFAALDDPERVEAALALSQRGALSARVAAALLRARSDARAGRGRVLQLRR